MLILQCVAYFFGAVFFFNSIPHLTNGVSGRKFQTVFAKPPGKGLSKPKENIYWGWINLAVAYVLIFQVGDFDFHRIEYALSFGAGGFLCSLGIANYFARFHST